MICISKNRFPDAHRLPLYDVTIGRESPEFLKQVLYLKEKGDRLRKKETKRKPEREKKQTTRKIERDRETEIKEKRKRWIDILKQLLLLMEREKDLERKRQKERERESERKKDREKERDKQTKGKIDIERHTERHREREPDRMQERDIK